MPKRARTTRRLEAWLKDTGLPLFVLNAQRRLVFFNHGSEALTGWQATDVLGQVCDYVTEPESNNSSALLASLAPPPDAWKGQPVNAPANIPRRDSDPIAKLIHFHPLTDDDQTVKAMLGVIVPMANLPSDETQSASRLLHAELAAMRHAIRKRYGEGTLITRSQAMMRVLAQMDLAHHSSASILLVGGMGVGKQHIARRIHYRSSIGKQAFVPLDCQRAATEDLEAILCRMQDETHADVLRPGVVYFDNIDQSPLDFQRSLVDWLNSNTGPNSIRIMAGSNEKLERLVESGAFLRKLYLAISTITIEVPSLRERPEDLEPLAQYFIEELNRHAQKQVGGFDAEAWSQLKRYNWPGNVAELRAVAEEAHKACLSSEITVDTLPFRFRAGVGAQTVSPTIRLRVEQLDPLLERIEREQIELALSECRHNKARAAELLGINRQRLYRRMEQLGIHDLEAKQDSPPSSL